MKNEKQNKSLSSAEGELTTSQGFSTILLGFPRHISLFTLVPRCLFLAVDLNSLCDIDLFLFKSEDVDNTQHEL